MLPCTSADSAAAAQKGFRRAKIPAGFKADLWATEPPLANPVAFSFDGKGRMFIAETPTSVGEWALGNTLCHLAVTCSALVLRQLETDGTE
jgi:hypothetical protein